MLKVPLGPVFLMIWVGDCSSRHCYLVSALARRSWDGIPPLWLGLGLDGALGARRES
jgi:hypothetical protein